MKEIENTNLKVLNGCNPCLLESLNIPTLVTDLDKIHMALLTIGSMEINKRLHFTI
jgi:hypothetical protein